MRRVGSARRGPKRRTLALLAVLVVAGLMSGADRVTPGRPIGARLAGTPPVAAAGRGLPVVTLSAVSGGRRAPSGVVPVPTPADPPGPLAGYPQPIPIPTYLDQGTLSGVPAGWQVTNHALLSGNLPRSYLMLRPSSSDERPLPIYVVLQGRGLTPQSTERITQLVAALGPAIDVFPAGYGRSWDAGGCCGIAHRSHVDDVAFLTQVVQDVVESEPDASAHRVYVIGYSNGGRMAMRLACAEPGDFAGIAAIEAVPAAPCASLTPLPTLLIDSTGDPLLTIPTHGAPKTMQGYREPTVGATVDEYQRLDGCGTAEQRGAKGLLTTRRWTACAGAGRLEYDQYAGGTHRWPRGDATTPAAQTLIARFFNQKAAGSER